VPVTGVESSTVRDIVRVILRNGLGAWSLVFLCEDGKLLGFARWIFVINTEAGIKISMAQKSSSTINWHQMRKKMQKGRGTWGFDEERGGKEIVILDP
jgi:hypothetical protein